MEEKKTPITGNFARDDGDEWAFGNEDVTYNIPTIEHNIRPKTNQSKNTASKSACTIFGAWNQIIRLFWLDLTPDKENEIWLQIVEYCTQFWYIKGSWWATSTAINTVCKWWNTYWYKQFWKEKVFYLVTSRNDSKTKEALKKGHLIWFTYNLNWNEDRYKGLVDKDNYKAAIGHRTNIKSPALTNATSWYKTDLANEGVHDSFYLYTNEYYIKDITKYIWKGVYANFYLLLPQSCMEETVEEVKQEIKEMKAINALIWVLSTTYGDLPVDIQWLSSSYASTLRNSYPEARKLIEDTEKKACQSVTDLLSYTWKYCDEETQKKFSELASFLREKYNLK